MRLFTLIRSLLAVIGIQQLWGMIAQGMHEIILLPVWLHVAVFVALILIFLGLEKAELRKLPGPPVDPARAARP